MRYSTLVEELFLPSFMSMKSQSFPLSTSTSVKPNIKNPKVNHHYFFLVLHLNVYICITQYTWHVLPERAEADYKRKNLFNFWYVKITTKTINVIHVFVYLIALFTRGVQVNQGHLVNFLMNGGGQ